RGHLVGHQCLLSSCLAFSYDGRILASGTDDTSVILWDVTGPSKARQVPVAPKELESLWADLADSDAAKAYQAICTFQTVRSHTVPFLQRRLRPAAAVDNERILQLIANLDSDTFTVREKASQDLERFGEFAELALRKALAGKPNSEVRRRIELLLESAGR